MSNLSGEPNEGKEDETIHGARREVRHLAQRHIDSQLRQFSDMDSKLGRLISLSTLAVAAGGGLLYRNLGSAEEVLSQPLVWVTLGLAASVVGIILLLVPYIGLFRNIPSFPGPDPEWYREKVEEELWTPEEIDENLARTFTTSVKNHNSSLGKIMKWRNAGVVLILISGVSYLVFVLTST